MRQHVGRVVDWLKAGGGVLVALLLFAQMIIVALRYVFSIGWPWALDLLVYMFFLSVLLPGLSVLASNASVRVDVFYADMRAGKRAWLDRAALLIFLFPAMAYATKASYPSMVSSWRLLEASPTIGGLPGYFVLKAALTLFFALMAVLALWMGLQRRPYGEGPEE